MMSVGIYDATSILADVEPYTMQPAFGLDIVKQRLRPIEERKAEQKVLACLCSIAGLVFLVSIIRMIQVYDKTREWWNGLSYGRPDRINIAYLDIQALTARSTIVVSCS